MLSLPWPSLAMAGVDKVRLSWKNPWKNLSSVILNRPYNPTVRNSGLFVFLLLWWYAAGCVLHTWQEEITFKRSEEAGCHHLKTAFLLQYVFTKVHNITDRKREWIPVLSRTLSF